MTKEENNQFLRRLINTLQEAEIRLEQTYKQKNPEEFNKTKKFMLQIHKKISEEIK